jgi:hypothetical protein
MAHGECDYIAIVDWFNPETDQTEHLRIHLHSSHPLADDEVIDRMVDIAADTIDEYKLKGHGVTDPTVLVSRSMTFTEECEA